MLLTDKFKFGKYGPKCETGAKTLEEVLKIEAGRDWLEWYVEQKPMKPEYADSDRITKNTIKRKLNQQQGKLNPGDVTSTMFMSTEIADLKKRIEIIELKLKSREELTPTKPTAESVAAPAKNVEGWDD